MYLCISLVILSLTGCSTVPHEQDWGWVNTFTMERTGIETRWEQTEDDAKLIQDETKRLLSDGLTEDDAVRIALLNNRRLQASFEEIGIARADLVQAGFFTNPDLSALLRFPFGGGGTNIEAAGILKISDFWQIPIRKSVAAARFEMTMSKVSEEIIAAAAEAKHVYNEYVALFLMKTELEKMKKQFEELRDHVRYRETYGFAHELDVHAARADVLDRQLELMRIESNLQVVRSRMNHAMGLSPDQDKYEVTGSLPEKFQPLPDLETLFSHACSARPDVRMAKKQIEESERIIALEKKRIFRDVDSGLAYARDTDGTDLLGPEVKLQLPLFDQNQAQIAKAEYRTRQARKELQNRIGIVREEVSSALRKVLLSREEIALIRDMILPVRGEAVSYADAYVDAMQLNMLYALEARQRLFQTRIDLLQALREHRNQEIELERVSGGKIPMSETEGNK